MNESSASTRGLTAEEIRPRVEALGDWFHKLNLRGVQTAPHHFLGDYPAVKWRLFAQALPADLTRTRRVAATHRQAAEEQVR